MATSHFGKFALYGAVRIISTATLKVSYAQPRCGTAEPVIKTWVAVTKAAAWADPLAVKAAFGQTDILQGGRVVFDLGGNKFRLVAKINYRAGIVFVRFIGTHAEYDRIDAATV